MAILPHPYPSGVPSTAAVGLCAGATRHLRPKSPNPHFQHVADGQVPSSESSGLGLEDLTGPEAGTAQPPGPHWRYYIDDVSLWAQEGHVDGEAHPQSVHAAAMGQQERSIETVTAQEPPTSLSGVAGHLDWGQDLFSPHEPGGVAMIRRGWTCHRVVGLG